MMTYAGAPSIASGEDVFLEKQEHVLAGRNAGRAGICHHDGGRVVGAAANRAVSGILTSAGAPRIACGAGGFLSLLGVRAGLGGYTILGFSQGKFSIVTDPSGQTVVSRDLTTINLQRGTGVARGTRTLMRLQEFREEIRGYLANR